jgi:flagellar M-ring protein FliF
VLDENNRTLAAGSEGDGFSGASAEEAKASTEAQLQARIKDIVEGVVGAGAARVQVTAEIDHSRSTTQEQRFDPDGQVVRSVSTNGAENQETSGLADGTVTAANNIPGGEAANQTPLGSTSTETTETTNFEISNTTTTTIREPGEVKRLAVAVAVDGVWTPGENGAEPTYAARSEEEMQQIKTLVRSSVGFNEERGDTVEVVNVRFSRQTSAIGGTDGGSPLTNFTTSDIMRGVELLVLLVTGLLLIFFVLRPLLKTAGGGRGGGGSGGPGTTLLQTQIVGPGGEILPGAGLLPGPSEVEQRIDLARIEGQVKASSVKRVAEFVEKHPDESVAIIRNWVAEG